MYVWSATEVYKYTDKDGTEKIYKSSDYFTSKAKAIKDVEFMNSIREVELDRDDYGESLTCFVAMTPFSFTANQQEHRLINIDVERIRVN